MKVRAAREADLEALARIVAETPLWQRYGVTPDSARAALSGGLSRGEAVLTIDVDGGLGGLAWVQAQAGFGRSPYLKWLGVAPGGNRRGVGRELLRGAEDAARSTRSELILLCSDFNHDGQRFYEREGYARVGALPDYVLSGVAELVYFKKL
ncbi:MAG: GNAT family N-acetyltransferase [Deltaproteobacteria bacterium]|nr:GNAT family N-acetyltransferase [Deltaproteobacteria bacterium]